MGEGLRDTMIGVNAERSAACGNCISRRAFFADSTAIAALAMLAASCSELTAPRQFDPITIKVSDFPDLATLNRFVKADGARAVKRTGTGTFAAFGLACTHEGTAVNLVDNSTTFFCPNHESRFDNNGQVTVGPAAAPLESLVTSYDAATGMLFVDGSPPTVVVD
jgi:Rieske Fe-S protein